MVAVTEEDPVVAGKEVWEDSEVVVDTEADPEVDGREV